MSDSAVAAEEAASERSHIAVFSAPADDPRARRPLDVVILAVAALVTVLAGWSHTAGSDFDASVLAFFSDGVPGWLSAIATMLFIVGGLLPVALIVAIWLFGDGRARVARDMFLAAVVALVIVTVTALLVSSEWPDILPELLEREGLPSFPIARLAFAVAVLRVANPYLSVPMRTLSRRIIVPMGLSAIVLSYGTVSSVVGAYAAGVAAAAAVHLAFGSGIGIPSVDRIATAFRSVDIDASTLTYLDEQPVGATLLRGRTPQGVDLMVKVYGRDAADAATASRVWRSMWYRDNTRSLTASGQQLVEHEGLLLLESERSGASTPELVTWGRGDAGDSIIATKWLDGDRLVSRSADEITDAALDHCWQALAQMHAAGIVHGAIDGRRLVLVNDHVVLDDLSAAAVSSDARDTSADVAQMLVTTAIAVGNERAIAAAHRTMSTDALVAALEVLQTGALSSELSRDLRHAKLKLKHLRSDLATNLDVEAPDLAQLSRVTWGGVAMVALTFFAASALIGALADIGLSTISDQFSDARWGWLAVAFVVAQMTNVAEWVSLTGMVARPVPFAPTIMFRYAISFISLAVPSEAGSIAMNIRYMQRLGVPPAAALAQGPLLTVVSKTIDILLLLITSRIIGQTLDLDRLDGGPILRLLILAVVAIVIGAIVTMAVPKFRNRIVPPIKEAFTAVREPLTDPERLLRIVGGSFGQRLMFAMVLAASVTAFSGTISFSEAIFVNSAVSLFVGLVPVPGGIGVAEAALTAGLTLVGVPEGPALAAAISHRIVTSYLPPIYGWYTTRWLTDREYL